MVYNDVQGAAQLAPAYDLVTTTAYIPKDRMALTLNGSTEWPTGKALLRFAEARSLASPRELRAILEQTCDALAETARKMEKSIESTPDFQQVGNCILSAWNKGIETINPSD